MGRTDEARAIRDELLELEADGQADAFQVALLEVALGNHERAMDWLEQAYEDRVSYMLYINRAPHFDPLRDNERFQALVRRMGW